MSKPRVIVLSVVEQGLSASQAAAKFGVSRQWVHRLLARYRDGGLDAVEARSRRPRANPRRTPDPVRARIVELRADLLRRGLDAGAATIAWHLQHEQQPIQGHDPPHPASGATGCAAVGRHPPRRRQ